MNKVKPITTIAAVVARIPMCVKNGSFNASGIKTNTAKAMIFPYFLMNIVVTLYLLDLLFAQQTIRFDQNDEQQYGERHQVLIGGSQEQGAILLDDAKRESAEYRPRHET